MKEFFDLLPPPFPPYLDPGGPKDNKKYASDNQTGSYLNHRFNDFLVGSELFIIEKETKSFFFFRLFLFVD